MAQNLRLYIQYDSLAANDLVDVLLGLDALYNGVVEKTPESEKSFLSVASVHTGRSIEIKFSDGWMPWLPKRKDGKVVIKVPRVYVVAWLILQAHNALIDGVLKERELWFGREVPPQVIKLLEGESGRVLREKAASLVRGLLQKNHFTQIELDGRKLKEDTPVLLPAPIFESPRLMTKPARIVLAPNITGAQFSSLERRLARKNIRLVRIIEGGTANPGVIVLRMRDAADLGDIKILKKDFPRVPILVIDRMTVPHIAHMVEGVFAR